VTGDRQARLFEDQVAHAISAPRFGPYLLAAGGNRSLALDLYDHNVYLSGSIHEALALVEVAVRNAIDVQLRRWNARQVNPATGIRHVGEWTIDPSHVLVRTVGKDLVKAKSRTMRRRQPDGSMAHQHDDVLTQLTFGTWRYLLPDGDPGKRRLWGDALSAAFSNLKGPEPRLVFAMDGIYRLRNRTAHLEPVFKVSALRRQVRNMRLVMRSIDPALEDWLNAVSRIDSVLAQAPSAAGTQ
jgi:hypothetical protein